MRPAHRCALTRRETDLAQTLRLPANTSTPRSTPWEAGLTGAPLAHSRFAEVFANLVDKPRGRDLGGATMRCSSNPRARVVPIYPSQAAPPGPCLHIVQQCRQ
eukprot:3331438-Pyramimonas_sp.AAC.1